MSVKVLQDYDFGGVAKATNLPAPSAASDAATKSYVDSAVEGLAWKDSARVASTANLNLAAPGATIDGITMVALDRVLVKNQSTASENGIYVWNGAATPATRALDASTFAELEQAIVTVEEGTSAGSTFRQTAVNGTLGSTSLSWASFGTSAPAASESTAGIAELATQAETDAGADDARIVTPAKLAAWSGKVRRFAQTIGDGSATQFTVTHNLNSRDVSVSVVRTSAPYDTVLTDAERDTVNSVVVRFAAAPASNAFRVVIVG